MVVTSRQIQRCRTTEDEMDGECDALGRTVRTGIWWGSLKKGENLEDRGINVRKTLKFIVMEWDMRKWTGLIRIRVGTTRGML